MIYPIFNTITTSSSLTITKNRNTFSNCPTKIETLSVAFPASRLTLAKTVNRFSAVLSTSTKSFL
jgi:hypothetical protein